MPEKNSVEDLLAKAEVAKGNAHNPYSEYGVGAAVEVASGEVYVGCNVENAAYTPTTHAEQNAVTTAVANGETEFVQLALVSDGENGVPPCGFCRQVLREFCADEFLIHVGTPDGFETYTLGEILPESFGPEDLEQAEVSQSH